MKSKLIFLLLMSIIVYWSIPKFLYVMGLYPSYINKVAVNAEGKRVLIITTSTRTLPDGKDSGATLSSITDAYYVFYDHGVHVDVASVRGGEVPIDRLGKKYFFRSGTYKRFKKDFWLKSLLENAINLNNIDVRRYDAIYVADGWGALYDMEDRVVTSKISSAIKNNKIVATVGAGSLALANVVDKEDKPFIALKKVTGVTNKQLSELKSYHAAKVLPEDKLRSAGALFKRNTGHSDTFSSRVEVSGNLVTGQNQNSAKEAAYKVLMLLSGEKFEDDE